MNGRNMDPINIGSMYLTLFGWPIAPANYSQELGGHLQRDLRGGRGDGH